MRQTSLNMVFELAKADPRVVFIGSDLGPDTLADMKAELPERYFMEGIAEQNLIGMAAGMAFSGLVPYLNTIATFMTRRCFEQVAVDLCLHDLPVRLISSGGGTVYAPLGPTHLAIEDIAIMRALPNMTIIAVADAEEMRRMMPATLQWPHPIYIRLGKGGDPIVTSPDDGFTIGKAIIKRPKAEILIVSTGIMLGPCLQAADQMAKSGINCCVLHMHTIKPLDVETLLDCAGAARLVVSVEEHVVNGGLGSAVLECLADHMPGQMPIMRRLGLPDAFPVHYGTQEQHLKHNGLDAAGIIAAVQAGLGLKSGLRDV